MLCKLNLCWTWKADHVRFQLVPFMQYLFFNQFDAWKENPIQISNYQIQIDICLKFASEKISKKSMKEKNNFLNALIAIQNAFLIHTLIIEWSKARFHIYWATHYKIVNNFSLPLFKYLFSRTVRFGIYFRTER